MDYTKAQAKQEALLALKKAIGKEADQPTIEMLETPPDSSLGDLAFPCFKMAKAMGRSPMELAVELSAKIGPTELLAGAKAVGPYVNFVFNAESYTERVLKMISVAAEKYGASKHGEGKRVVIDYANMNTHKEFHIGHTRNVLLGQALANIFEANGFDVVPASYIGDIGAHVAKVIWAIQKFYKDEEIPVEDRAVRLGQIYTEATKKIEEKPEYKEEVDAVQRKLEAKEEPEYSLWKETREWSLVQFKEIFAELHATPSVWYFESQVEEPGKEIVKELLQKGIAKKSEGATIIDLEDEDLGVFLVLKSDGSSLYSTKDLALAYKKREDYGQARQIFVVDNRQSLHFKQLFATLTRMGFTGNMKHVAYDMVVLEDGAMSSRKGNIVLYRDAKQDMMDHVRAETLKRHEDWSEKQVADVAEKLAHAAIAFTMLKQDANSTITFNPEEAISVEGFTGPYIQYTIARIHGIFAKATEKPELNAKLLTHHKEIEIAKKLADYPELLLDAAMECAPAMLAIYAFELAKLFAEYYHDAKILSEDADLTRARLMLLQSILQVLENACELLTIEPVKNM